VSEQLQLGNLLFDRWREIDARIEEALRSNLFSESDKEILRVVASHKSAHNAIRAEEIASRAGLAWNEQTRRQITGTVETAILLFHVPIGGLRTKPYGYFLIVTPKDLELALGPLTGEFRSLLRRIRALTSKQEAARLFGQAMLRLDKESGGQKGEAA
jgi:hypothetical protein